MNNESKNNNIQEEPQIKKDDSINKDSQISELKMQLNEEKNKNQKLIDENNNLKENINKLNLEILNLNDKIKLLENNLAQKNIEVQNNISEDNNKINDEVTKNEDEKIFTINILSQEKHCNVNHKYVCKNTDLFVKLEEKVYEDFPLFKDYETYFEVDSKKIKRFKTLDDNNIKNDVVINLFIYEEKIEKK